MPKYYIYRYDSLTENNDWVIMPSLEFEDARKSARTLLNNEAADLERVVLVADDAPTEHPFLKVGMIAQAGKDGAEVRLISYSLQREPKQ